MIDPQHLRKDAEALAAPLPPLLAAAEHLAASIQAGSHGRRRVGQGDEFWQYRPSHAGDTLRQIDWRRSAKTDSALFVREKEWQASQTVMFWVDQANSMRFSSDASLPRKCGEARVLALALAVLLNQGGEKIGLSNSGLPPRSGKAHLERLTAALSDDEDAEYAAPVLSGVPSYSRAVFVSDFLGDFGPIGEALTKSADKGISGALVQVLDPQEEAFPFGGRTIFESVGGSISHETLKARNLRDRYIDRLEARKEELRSLSRVTGWQYYLHHTDASASSALLWLYMAMERSR